MAMRAVAIFEHGTADKLTVVDDWPEPEPGRDDVVVDIEACALNHLDIFVRRGMPGVHVDLPRIPGGDIAGRIVRAGSGVDSATIGQRVLIDPMVALPNGKAGALGEHANGGVTERIAIPFG